MAAKPKPEEVKLLPRTLDAALLRLEVTRTKLGRALDALASTSAALASTREELAGATEELEDVREELAETHEDLASVRGELARAQQALADKDVEIRALVRQVKQARAPASTSVNLLIKAARLAQDGLPQADIAAQTGLSKAVVYQFLVGSYRSKAAVAAYAELKASGLSTLVGKTPKRR